MPRMPATSQMFSRIRAETLRMIKGEEGIAVEYKRSVDAVEQDDLVALANSNGGTILVGVEEQRSGGRQHGQIVGCVVGEEARRTILNKAGGCLPPVNLKITVERSGSRRILRLDVEEASKKPCCTPSGTYKIRKNGTKVAIDPELMTAMIMERESEEFLSRFRAAGDAIIEALNGVRKSLEEQVAAVQETAEQAAGAAEDAVEAARSAEAAAEEAGAAAME